MHRHRQGLVEWNIYCTRNVRKNQQIGLSQIKTFDTAKETSNTVKGLWTEWAKAFANDSSDKELISRRHEEWKILLPHGRANQN